MGTLLGPFHRKVMFVVALAIVLACALLMNWSWLPKYGPLILRGIWTTAWLTVVTMGLGMMLAIGLGIAQAAGPWFLAWPARTFCTIIRGTPLLLQL